MSQPAQAQAGMPDNQQVVAEVQHVIDTVPGELQEGALNVLREAGIDVDAALSDIQGAHSQTPVQPHQQINVQGINQPQPGPGAEQQVQPQPQMTEQQQAQPQPQQGAERQVQPQPQPQMTEQQQAQPQPGPGAEQQAQPQQQPGAEQPHPSLVEQVQQAQQQLAAMTAQMNSMQSQSQNEALAEAAREQVEASFKERREAVEKANAADQAKVDSFARTYNQNDPLVKGMVESLQSAIHERSANLESMMNDAVESTQKGMVEQDAADRAAMLDLRQSPTLSKMYDEREAELARGEHEGPASNLYQAASHVYRIVSSDPAWASRPRHEQMEESARRVQAGNGAPAPGSLQQPQATPNITPEQARQQLLRSQQVQATVPPSMSSITQGDGGAIAANVPAQLVRSGNFPALADMIARGEISEQQEQALFEGL